MALVGLTLLGFLTANLVGRTLLETGEGLLERTPVVRGLYKSLKQVFQTVFSQSDASFKKVGLVEFPVKGTWSVVFISQPASPEIADALPGEEDQVGVFLPCSPNPTTGFFFYLPRREVIEIAISVEDAAKLVVSAGLIAPGRAEKKTAAQAPISPPSEA